MLNGGFTPAEESGSRRTQAQTAVETAEAEWLAAQEAYEALKSDA